MSTRLGHACLVALLVASSSGCKVEGETSPGGAGPNEASDAQACAKGDRAAGNRLVTQFRQQRLSGAPPSFADQRASLREACDGACSPACLELARTSASADELAIFSKAACTHGETLGCTLSAAPQAGSAGELCDAGEVLGCAALLSLEPGEHAPNWERVTTAAAKGCASDDGRACGVQAWIRCAVAGQCDAEALDAARKAAQLVPIPEILETLALVQCHAGQPEQADESLSAACEAGTQDACARRCESLLTHPVLVRETSRGSYERVATLIALQPDATADWYSVLSAMDAAQLVDFERVLDRFTPKLSDPGSKAQVAASLREQYPALIEAILRSPQLDAKQIQYWLGRLPDMTEEQRANLLESLRKQWWVVPGDDAQPPQAYVDHVRLRSVGMLSAPGE
jgi:hypothetical protein